METSTPSGNGLGSSDALLEAGDAASSREAREAIDYDELSRKVRSVTRHPFSNLAVKAAIEAAEELSKIGTKDRDLRRWVSRLIVWGRTALQGYQIQADIILAKWGERDDAGDLKIVKEMKDGEERHRVVMRNEAMAQLEQNALSFEEARGDGDRPEPVSADDIEKHFVVLDKTMKQPTYVSAVSPELMARLGPFVSL